MLFINEKSKELIKLSIKGSLLVAYGSGLQGISNYDTEEWTLKLYDLIEEILDKQEGT